MPITGVEKFGDCGWGFEQIRISKDQCEEIYKLLELNENNVVKTFDCVWRSESFDDDQRKTAPMLLSWIERVATLKSRHVCGRSFQRVWDYIIAESNPELIN